MWAEGQSAAGRRAINVETGLVGRAAADLLEAQGGSPALAALGVALLRNLTVDATGEAALDDWPALTWLLRTVAAAAAALAAAEAAIPGAARGGGGGGGGGGGVGGSGSDEMAAEPVDSGLLEQARRPLPRDIEW